MYQKKIFIGGLSAYNKESNTFQLTTADQLKVLFQKNDIPFLFTEYNKSRLLSLLNAVKTVWLHRRAIDIAILPLFGTYNSLLWQRILSYLLHLLHKKIILVVHGGSIPKKLKTRPEKFLPSLRRAAVIVSPSGFTQYALQEFNIKTVIIENVINSNEYLFHPKKIIRPKLLWMRAFSDIYNPQMAVRVAKILSEKYPGFKMVMAGADKGLLTEIKKMIREYKLGDIIELPGYIETTIKNKLADDYDIYICTNKIDNAPVSIIEFMALGLAIVAVNIGGIPYIIEDGKNGLLVIDSTGAAAQAGIRRGDVILGLNNSETQSVELFNKQINGVAAGKTVAVLVQRGDNTLYVPIKVAK